MDGGIRAKHDAPAKGFAQMSMMRCAKCDRLVDTDEDCDSLYVVSEPLLDCVCEHCRERYGIRTEFDE